MADHNDCKTCTILLFSFLHHIVNNAEFQQKPAKGNLSFAGFLICYHDSDMAASIGFSSTNGASSRATASINLIRFS